MSEAKIGQEYWQTVIDMLKEHGRCKNAAFYQESYCMGHAMATICNSSDISYHRYQDAVNEVIGVIKDNFPERSGVNGHTSIPYFNDHPKTTDEDVFTVLEKMMANA